MATKKGFTSLDELKKLIKKDKIDTVDIPDVLMKYIESVKYTHFTKQLKWQKHDENIDLKLIWVYELAEAIKTILKTN